MQQTLNCPSCGSPINESQQFCGICGTQLLQSVQQPEVVPPVETAPQETTTTIPITDSRSTVIEDISQTTPAAQYAAASTPSAETAPPSEKTTAAAGGTSAAVWSAVGPPRRTGLLRLAGVVFQVVGWIVLVVGCLASIAMAVFAIMGGQFISLIPGMANIAGNMAINIAIGGLIMSIIYGLGILAFSEICFILTDISKVVRLPK